MTRLELGALLRWLVSLTLIGMTQKGVFVGVAFSPPANLTPRAPGFC
jgi:hypothetical protein